jgi:tRNA-Thr(GGU) m(6)t(6)A37 methyltransferase TsaA
MVDLRQPVTESRPGSLTFRPIGIVHSPFKSPEEIPVARNADSSGFDDIRGELEIDRAFAEGLKDIEGFSHLFVVFAFHRTTDSRLLVRPPFDSEVRGVFASRSPHRPNPIGLTVVKLEGRRGNVLDVSGLDMIEGTPILDLKPYTERDRKNGLAPGWIGNREKRSADRGGHR